MRVGGWVGGVLCARARVCVCVCVCVREREREREFVGGGVLFFRQFRTVFDCK